MAGYPWMLVTRRLVRVTAPWIDPELAVKSMSSGCAATNGHSCHDSCLVTNLACHPCLGLIGHMSIVPCQMHVSCFD